jgi:hypothetical protein
MRPFPSKDAVDFTAALALGAAIGWSVVTMLRSQERTPTPTRRLRPGRRSRRRGTASQSSFLRELKDEAGRLARGAGEELAHTALSRLGGAFLGAWNSGGR